MIHLSYKILNKPKEAMDILNNASNNLSNHFSHNLSIQVNKVFLCNKRQECICKTKKFKILILNSKWTHTWNKSIIYVYKILFKSVGCNNNSSSMDNNRDFLNNNNKHQCKIDLVIMNRNKMIIWDSEMILWQWVAEWWVNKWVIWDLEWEVLVCKWAHKWDKVWDLWVWEWIRAGEWIKV